MIHFSEQFVVWLGDFFLLSSALLALVAVANATFKQPALRMAFTKASLAAVVLLAVACALPRWSVVHLRSAEQPSAAPQTVTSDFEVPTNTFAIDPSRANALSSETHGAALEATAAAPQVSVAKSIAWNWKLVATLTYAAGAFCIAAWLIIGHLTAHRLRRSAAPAPAELATMLTTILGSRRDPSTWPRRAETRKIDLLTSKAIDVPVALGIFRPAIILPTKFVPGQSAIHNSQSEIASILAHELAHIHNHDLTWLAVSRGLLTLLWAHPLYWLLRRRLRLDQELLADAAAAELTTRQHYAEQLLAWARNLGGRSTRRPMSAVGMWEGPSQLCRRIETLIDDKLVLVRKCPRHWRIAATLVAIAATLVLSGITVQPQRLALANESSTTTGPSPSPTATGEAKSAPVPDPAAAARSLKRPDPNTAIGRAVDENNKPVAGAEVFLFRTHLTNSERTQIAQQKTDQNGEFKFGNVIDIEKEFPNHKFPSYNDVRDDFVQGVLRMPGRTSVWWLQLPQLIAKQGCFIPVKMPAAATLRGHVVGPDGKPVSGALVFLSNGQSNRWDGASSSRTDADGNYEITDAAAFDRAEYRKQMAEMMEQAKKHSNKDNQTADFVALDTQVLCVQHPDFATFESNCDKIPGTTDVQLRLPAIIEGRVTYADSGKPAAGALVTATTPMTVFNQQRPNDTPPVIRRVSARTDANGNYRIAKLPAGTYDLFAEATGWVNVGIDALAVETGKITVPEMTLSKGGVISARLVDAKTRQPIPINADTRAMLIAQAEPWHPVSGPITHPYAEPTADGRFELRTTSGKKTVVAPAVDVSGEMKWIGRTPAGVEVVDGQTINVDVPVADLAEAAKADRYGSSAFLAVTRPPDSKDEEKDAATTTKPATERTPNILSYGDGKPDGKKSYGGSGHMIEFEMPDGVTKVKGIRIHGSRYGLPQAPDENFEITFLSDKRDGVLHTESAPYKLFKRGKENWVRIAFDKEVELPKKFWIALDFNAEQTKGVYLSYDTSTKGKYSRVGNAGDDKEPKETDFNGDWMVQVMLAPATKEK